MTICDSLIAELQHEAATTRKMLEWVPQDSLFWKPHDKSRTIGEIASHIANLPGLFIVPIGRDGFDRYEYKAALTDDVSIILETFDANIAGAVEALKALSDGQLMGSWCYTYGEQVIFELPRLLVIRATALNHMIHHRGQLSVYLRLLDIPLPPVYGPTADES